MHWFNSLLVFACCPSERRLFSDKYCLGKFAWHSVGMVWMMMSSPLWWIKWLTFNYQTDWRMVSKWWLTTFLPDQGWDSVQTWRVTGLMGPLQATRWPENSAPVDENNSRYLLIRVWGSLIGSVTRRVRSGLQSSAECSLRFLLPPESRLGLCHYSAIISHLPLLTDSHYAEIYLLLEVGGRGWCDSESLVSGLLSPVMVMSVC